MADPICDDINTSLPLELYTVTFESAYYVTTQGRKKLSMLQEDIQRLTSIRHPSLVSVFAVKLVHSQTFSSSSSSLSTSTNLVVQTAGLSVSLAHSGQEHGKSVSPDVQLYHSGNAPQLMILTERMPGLTLWDVLEDCDFMREDKASVSCSVTLFIHVVSLAPHRDI